MTNGEKILSLFPDMVTDCREMYVFAWIEQKSAHFSKEWWSTEYKELSYSEKPNKSEIPTGSTTKNNLAVDCINKAEFVEKLESETIGLQSWQKSLVYQVMDDCHSVTPQEPTNEDDIVVLDISEDIDTLSKYQTKDGEWHEGVIPTSYKGIYKKFKKATEHDLITRFAIQETLEELRERVELEKLGYPPNAGYYKAIMKVLEIIDEYKAGSEEQG